MDDFGAGYASLSYLRNLPFSKLKIDREFVTDVDLRRESRAICRALVGLGEGLGLKVLAEGAETAEEVTCLRSLGCELYQGFSSAAASAQDFASGAQSAALRRAGIALKAGNPAASFARRLIARFRPGAGGDEIAAARLCFDAARFAKAGRRFSSRRPEPHVG